MRSAGLGKGWSKRPQEPVDGAPKIVKIPASDSTWRSGRVVEGSGFENRRGGNSTRGSNPFFSARRWLRT